MDALEGFVWGQTWQLGYDRNPWMNAWLTSIAVFLGGQSGWLVYLLSQGSIALCFLSIWRLGKKFLSPHYALIAVFLLEGVQYYSLAAVDFNDNVLELGLWAALSLCFYNAITEQKLRDWLLTGIFAALSLMTKYYAVVMFIPMLLLVLCSREGRASFKTTGIYWCMLIFFCLIAPHFIWLVKHDFITIKYALARVHTNNSSWHQNSYWYFAVAQLLAFTVPLLLFLLLWLVGKNQNNSSHKVHKNDHITHFTKLFLVTLGLGPYLITIIFSALFDLSLHTMWGTPLLSLWGLLLVTFIPPQISPTKFYWFIATTFSVLIGIAAAYSYNLVYTGYESSATYPGKAIFEKIIKEWSAVYPQHCYPSYVIGDRYSAGNIAYFSTNNTKVLRACIWDNKTYSCASDEEIYSNGAVFIWRVGEKDYQKEENKELIHKIKNRFPKAVFLENKEFKWIYHPQGPSLYIGLALLPPKH